VTVPLLPPPAWPAPAGPPWPAPPETPAAQATPAPWWDLDRSLRARLTAIVALAVAVAIACAVGIAYVAVRRDLSGAVDTQLRRQTADLQQQALETRGIGVQLRTGVGGYVQVLNASGVVEQPDVQRGVVFPVRQADLDVARGRRSQVWRDDVVDGVRVRVLTSRLLPSIGYAVQVAVPLTTVREQLRRLAASFAVLFLAGLAVAMALA
jgi:two-component system sensor histidine kinase MprB